MRIAAWINPSAYTDRQERLIEHFERASYTDAYLLQPEVYGGTAEAFGATIDALTGIGVRCHLWVWCLEFARPWAVGDQGETQLHRFVASSLAPIERFPALSGNVHLDGIRVDKYDVSGNDHRPRIDDRITAGITRIVEAFRASATGELSAAIRTATYDGGLSGGPYTDWPRGTPFFREVQQDALNWGVDFLVPMNYQSSINDWTFELDWWRTHHDISRVIMGVGWCPDRGSYRIDIDGVERRLDAADGFGFAGASIFQAIQPGYDDAREVRLEELLQQYGKVDLMALIDEMRADEAELREKAAELTALADRIAARIVALQELDAQVDELADVIDEG
jgi:hypothetical protein